MMHELPENHDKLLFSEFQKYFDKTHLKNLEANFIFLCNKKTDSEYA